MGNNDCLIFLSQNILCDLHWWGHSFVLVIFIDLGSWLQIHTLSWPLALSIILQHFTNRTKLYFMFITCHTGLGILSCLCSSHGWEGLFGVIHITLGSQSSVRNLLNTYLHTFFRYCFCRYTAGWKSSPAGCWVILLLTRQMVFLVLGPILQIPGMDSIKKGPLRSSLRRHLRLLCFYQYIQR